MAVKPSNAALTALRNTRRAKQEELGRAYEAMGGSNTALVSNSQFAPNTIPSLKRAIENRYAEAQSGGRDTYGDLQAMTPAYNDYKVRETEEALNRLGQTDIARGSNTFTVERAKQGHMQSGLVNSLAENEKLGGILSSLTGSSFPYQAFQTTQNASMKGTLTDEMKALGLTQEDIDRWNRQQNELERREVETNYASQHPFMATLNSFPEMAAGSAEGVLDKIANYVQGKPLESSPINAELYRNAVSQDMSGVGNFAYGVGTSMGDMGLASLFGGVGGPTVMGLEKANSVMNEAIDRGLTPNQIMGEGLASGVSTAITEKLLGPFGKFAGNNALKAAIGEGLQEGAEDLVDTLFDEFITRAGGNNEKSVWNQNLQMYRDAGYSEEDAKKAVVIDYLKQLGIDFGAGAISGGIFQGGNNVLNQRNIINGRPRVNTETENNATADTNTEVQNELPILRDSRAEEAAIQEQRNAEMAQLTEALAQMQGQQNTQPQVQNDPEEMEYLRNALLDANRVQANPEVFRANPEDVIYHAGKLSRLNKAETNGRFSGSNRGTGYFGTGHYFVDNNTLNELEQSGYKGLPLSSVDISGYTNLFRADTDTKANNLHNFLSDMTRFTQGSDRVSIEELYEEYTKAFDGEGNVMPYDAFVNRISELTEYMKNSNMEDRGDSVSTQFMKSLGYGGVDTRGTRYADTRYGTVIYDLDENSVLQGNIPALQRTTTDMLTRSENRNIFDAEEDARIQKILDDQAKNARVDARFREIYDDTEITQNEERLESLDSQRKEIESIVYDLTDTLNNIENYVREKDEEFQMLGFDAMTEDQIADDIKTTSESFTESLNERKAELEALEKEIAELEARNNVLYEDANKAREQARADVENATQSNDTYEPVSGLTFGTAHITDKYVDIDGYSNRKSEKALLNQLAKAVEPYSKSEADNLRDSVKYNEIVQYPGSQGNNEYILEWENVPGASRNVDADGVDTLLSRREDAYENSSTEEAPANYYVHIRFPIDALNEGYQRNNEQQTERTDEEINNINTVEDATAALNEEVSALKNEVGNHPLNIEYFSRNEHGEVESEDSDRVQTGRYKTSKAYTNTAEKSGNLTDEQRRMVEQNGSMLYQENSWKESTEEAEKRIIEGGWQGEFEKLTAKDANTFNNVDVDEMFMLWRHYKEQAVALDKKGLDSTSTWQKTVDCLTQLKAAGSHAGSELNAFKKWSMNNTPEGLLTEAEVIIDEYINGLNEGAKKLAKKNPWLAQIARETKGKTRQMDVAFIKQFLTEAEKLAPTHTVNEGETLADIAKAYNTTVDALIELNGKDIKPGDTITVSRLDPDSDEARVIMANLGKMVNTQIPVSLREKITTLLMDNMLGNFRTLITRNFGGNVGYNLIEQNITKNIAAKIDKALSAKRGTARTISENTKEGRQAYREGFKEAFKQEWFDLTNNLRTARSGENNLRTAVANNRQIFSDKNIFGKIGNMYDRLVRSGLSVGDRPFYEGVYRQYMVEYKKMFDQGLLKDMSEEEFNETAQALAQIKALEAVYQDDSEMAQAFMAAKNMVSLASKAVTGVDIMSQFTMPFVKTPANIAQRAIEYSPVGFIKNAVKTIRELRHTMTANGQMDFDQQRFATDTARNLVGSVMWGIALYMASAGFLTGAYDDDEDMRAAQKEAGMQEYALHLPINGGMDIDVSSMPVIGNDLVAAAASYDAFKNNPELSVLQRIGKGFSAGIEKQFESSALQGLQRLFGAGSSYGYGGQGNSGSIMEQAKDTIKAGASQLIPSLLRQFSTAADPYQRRLTGLNADDYYINNLRSAIPWLRQDLQPKIGRTGEVLEQNHSQTVAGRWFNNFINPFNVTYGTEDAVRDEAMRLYESTGNNIAFQPYVSMKELKTDDHIPTDEEFTQYQQNAYGAMNQIATQVINSSYYQNLTDGDKVALLAKLYQAVKAVEKANILGSDKSNLSGEAKAYDEGGAEGLMNYLTAQSALSSLGVTNNEDNRNAVLASLNANGGDLSALAEQYDSSVGRAGTDLDLLMNNQYSGLIETIGTWDSDAQRELREEINSIINGVEFNSMVGIDKDYDGAKKAYDEGGVNGLAEYLFPATVLKNNGMTNNEKNREMILNAYNEGGASAVQQIIQASQALGNDSNLTYKYEHATSYIPSLTPTQFQTTWNAINTDGNTSIKIDELIDYLNQNPGNYDAQSALQYWNAFYTGTSEKIPVLVNGHWEAKKA